MRLDAKLRSRVLKRRPTADVYDRPARLSLHQGMRGIDAVGRKDQAGDIQVRRWKTQVASQLVARDNPRGERVGSVSHVRNSELLFLAGDRAEVNRLAEAAQAADAPPRASDAQESAHA